MAYCKDMQGLEVNDFRQLMATAEDTIFKSCKSSLGALLLIPAIRKEIQAILRQIYLDIDVNFVLQSNSRHLQEIQDEGFEYTFSVSHPIAGLSAIGNLPPGPVFTAPPPPPPPPQDIYRQIEAEEDRRLGYGEVEEDDGFY